VSKALTRCVVIASTWAASATMLFAQVGSRTGGMNGRIATPSRQFILPVAFEENRGQASENTDFVAMGQQYSAEIRASSIDLRPASGPAITTAKNGAGPGIRIVLSAANQEARGQGEDKLPGYSNYLFGTDPAKWITYVDHYAKVRYPGVYPGIDLVLHGNDNHLEQDFVVHPGADPKDIDLHFEGVKEARRTAEGDLELQTGGASFRLKKPQAYQVLDGKEHPITVGYSVQPGTVRFRLGPYDAHADLIIDPVLVYSTFFGAPSPDLTDTNISGTSISQLLVDASGIYLTGTTTSANFPVTPGVVQPAGQGIRIDSSFVSKLDPTGQTLLFSTYLQAGGTPPAGFAIDASHNIYIGVDGANGASPLPIPVGSQPFQGVSTAAGNVGIVKLNSTGTAVLAGTYFGGSGGEAMGGLAVDAQGNIYVSGTTGSNDLPLKNPIQNTLGTGNRNGFAAEFDPNLSALVYSTYFGANSGVQMSLSSTSQLAVDSLGQAYIIGLGGTGFPTTPGAYQPTCGAGVNCMFLAVVKPGGTGFLYSTFIDSTNGNPFYSNAISVDGTGNAYIAGVTNDPNFPVSNPIQACTGIGTNSDMFDSFVSEFNSAGSLTFSTCLGNLPAIFSPTMTLDSSGNVYVSGVSGPGLPLQNPIDANPPTLAFGTEGPVRPFISEISSSSHTLVFSSYVAEDFMSYTIGEFINSVAVDPGGNVYLAGESEISSSTPNYSFLPIFNAMQPAFNTVNCGPLNCALTNPPVRDGFVIKISPSAGAAAAVAPGALVFGPTVVGSITAAQTATISDLGTTGLTVSNIAVSGDFAIQSNNCGSVAPSGGSCAIQVTFTPTALGTRNGALTITDSSAGSPRQIALTGTGATGNLTPSAISLTFPNQAMATTSGAQTIILTAGAAAIQSFNIQTSGDFSETNNCGISDPAFFTCALLVYFTPTTTGPRTGIITITDSAPNSPQIISMTGTGIAAIGIGVAPASPPVALIVAGSTASYSLTIGGEGLSGTASLSCTGAPAGATCSVPPTVSVSATSATTFAVTVTTTPRTAAASRFVGPYSFPSILLALVFAFVAFLGRHTTSRWVHRWALGLFLLASLGALYSCGGGNAATSPSGTPAGIYQIAISARLGSTSQSTSLTLNVQ
jgi:hypothetical protein